MNTNSATPRPCAGCSCDLGHVMHALSINHDGWRYEVCGRGCLDRLMQRISASSTTTTSATNDTVRVFGAAKNIKW
jgi:hypothetical protein